MKQLQQAGETANIPPEFYPRVINNTDITFSYGEMTMLNKGLKYNLNFKHKNWFTTLALEAQTAINQLPPQQSKTPIRFQVTKGTQKLYTQFQTQNRYNNTRALIEKKLSKL